MTGGFHYDRAQLAAALSEVGVRPGAVVFSHSNVGFFGVPREGRDAKTVFDTVLGAFFDVLGKDGTLVVPTFTYSFPRGLPFDPDQTPSDCGMFAEMLRQHASAVRSHDPVYSVAAIGARAQALTADVPNDSFGPDSFWGRFCRADGFICNLNFDAGSTFIHYVEKCLRVPYRYDKAFAGTFVYRGRVERRRAVIWVRDLSTPDTIAQFEPFDRLARESGMLRSAGVGRGAVTGISARDTDRLMRDTLPCRPWLLTRADITGTHPNTHPIGGVEPFRVPCVDPLPTETLAQRLAAALGPLPRIGVGPGVDASFACIAQVLPLRLQYRQTGTRVGEVIVPERWRVRRARVRGDNGDVIADLQSPGLRIPAHSRSYVGRVSREELMRHVITRDNCVIVAPTADLLEQNDWGLALSQELLAELRGDIFDVTIDVEQCQGMLLTAEASLPGDGPELLISADLGEDDLAEAASAIAFFDQLSRQPGSAQLRLLLYPRPFRREDLWPDAVDQIISFGELTVHAAGSMAPDVLLSMVRAMTAARTKWKA